MSEDTDELAWITRTLSEATKPGIFAHLTSVAGVALSPAWIDALALSVLPLMEQAWDEGAHASIELHNTGTRMTLKARIPFPADENPYRSNRRARSGGDHG